jgi:hypothetical protein
MGKGIGEDKEDEEVTERQGNVGPGGNPLLILPYLRPLPSPLLFYYLSLSLVFPL